MERASPWNKYFFGALLAFGLIIGIKALHAAPVEELPQMAQEMFNPSVQIGEYCSGTVISSVKGEGTLVLTAKHCTEQVGQKVVIKTFEYDDKLKEQNEISLLGEVILQDKVKDLALIKLNNIDITLPAATVASTNLDLLFGQDVWSVSYPANSSKTFTQGVLGYQELVADFGGQFYIRSTALITGGSSGSGLFAKENGHYVLIGTLTGGFVDFHWMNFYTTLDDVLNFLGKNEKESN